METVIVIENVCSVNRALMRCRLFLVEKRETEGKKWGDGAFEMLCLQFC